MTTNQARHVLLAAGSNSSGQLGLGHKDDAHTLSLAKCVYGCDFPPPGRSLVQVACGSNHTVAIVDGGGLTDDNINWVNGDCWEIWVCGRGKEGQLGKRKTNCVTFELLDQRLDLDLDSVLTEDEKGRKWQPKTIACGWNSTFITFVCSDDHMDDLFLVLGTENDFGQLGIGTEKHSTSSVHRIRFYKLEELDSPLRFVKLASGLRHTLVWVEQHFVGEESRTVCLYGWGAARHGQLDSPYKEDLPAIYWNPHLVDQWESLGLEIDRYASLSAGKEHTIYSDPCRMDQGCSRLFILGSNRRGQRQIATKSDANDVSAVCTWNGTFIRRSDHSIICSGNNSRGQLGVADELSREGRVQLDTCLRRGKRQIGQFVCGSEHCIILTLDKESFQGSRHPQIWGWGWNEHGNLAQGDEDDRKAPVRIWPTTESLKYAEPPVEDEICQGAATDIWAGCGTTFIQIDCHPNKDTPYFL